jgi:transcription antitermination factor NusG
VAWYAAHVRSNFERRVVRCLEGRERVETFLPTYRAARRDAGGAAAVERPLFPGYVFVRLADPHEDRIAVLRATGVVRLVEFGGRPAPVGDEVIRSLRIISSGRAAARPHPLLREGRLVRVVGGPFAGATGRLARGPGRKPRLVVTIEILGRAAAVPVEPADVVPAG